MGFKNTRSDSSALPQHGDEGADPVQLLLAALADEAPHEFVESDGVGDRGESEREDGMPHWFDEERYKRGAETFERNIFLMFVGKMTGLLSLLAIPSIVKVLAQTGQSGRPHQAFRRYVDTVRHMLFWYRTSLEDPKSLARGSLAVVRGHHLRGAAAARRAGLRGISQQDMALTQFAFCGFAVRRRRMLQLDASDRDLLDFVHVWRTLGHLIGIKDRFNLCQFDTDIERTDVVLEEVCAKWLAPALASPPAEFAHMSRALLDGLWCMMPVLEYTSFVHFTQELAGVPLQQRSQLSKSYGPTLLALLHLVPNSMAWPILGQFLRKYHNASMRFSLFMSTYYPLFAWFSFPGNSSTMYKALVAGET